MSKEPDRVRLPLSADPAWGALVGTFLLASCLAGPIGIALVLVVLIVIEVRRRRKHRGPGSASRAEATDDAFAARFRNLENDILQDDRHSSS